MSNKFITVLIIMYVVFTFTAFKLGQSFGYNEGLDFCIESLEKEEVSYPQPDSTFVPHKFLSGEMARLNNEIEQLQDSIRRNVKTWPWWACNPIPEGEVIGSFTATVQGGTQEHKYNIIWTGDRAVVQEVTLPKSEPKVRKS